jgi:hypothetical protein
MLIFNKFVNYSFLKFLTELVIVTGLSVIPKSEFPLNES